jgi:hypothetical protein
VSEDDDLRLAQPRADGLDQVVEVGDELLDRHGGARDRAVERLPRAALVPVDDRVALLQWRVKERNHDVSLIPGPPCSKINGGFATLMPWVSTHWSSPLRRW